MLIDTDDELYQNIFTFEFDPFKLAQKIGKENQFSFLATAVLKENMLLDLVNASIFKNFARQI